jgi:hypothetical protein
MSLTGDELTLNDKSYSIKDKNGNDFNLGKLLKRDKTYSPFHESYSLYNNIFEFENKPDKSLVPAGVNGYYNTKMFNEVTTGGKRKSKKRKSRKVKKNLRKLTRRR